MDIRVLEAQQWLNENYGNNPLFDRQEEDGVVTTLVMMGLVEALQIELNIGSVTGIFGNQTLAACPTLKLGDTGNIVRILQHGLFCKGYDPGLDYGNFDSQTEQAIRDMQTDAGLIGAMQHEYVSPILFQAILSMEWYKLVSNGDPVIREMQQTYNYYYQDYIGICPCDGVCSRSTVQAMIYVLQAMEHLPTDVANGNFGPTTRRCCPNLPYDGEALDYFNEPYGDAAIQRLTQLFQYALHCYDAKRGQKNRFSPGVFNGKFTVSTSTSIQAFQRFVGLDVTGNVTINEWMALFVSYGNPSRSAEAIDCYTRLSDAYLEKLSVDGYKIVGRYLTGDVVIDGQRVAKNLLRPEMRRIFAHGMKLFLIYQDAREYMTENDTDDLYNYFTESRGYSDAEKAFCTAKVLGVPEDEIIYFAVDYDFMESEVYAKVVPYFKGINDYASKEGRSYKIGIYGSRNTCSIVADEGYSISSFVSDMSSGYSGNMGFPLPDDWAFDQIDETSLHSNDGVFGIDRNVVSERYTGFKIIDESNDIDGYEANGTALILHSDNFEKKIPVYWSKVLENGEYVAKNPMFDYILPDTCFNLRPSYTEGSISFVYFLDKGGRLNAGFIDMKDINEDPQTSTYPYQQGHVTRDSKTGSSSITFLPDPTPPGQGLERIFIVTSPVTIYKQNGDRNRELPVNSRITIANNCETGAKFPARITAVQFMLPSAEGGVFEFVDPDMGYGWVDLDIGLKPDKRKLINEWN